MSACNVITCILLRGQYQSLCHLNCCLIANSLIILNKFQCPLASPPKRLFLLVYNKDPLQNSILNGLLKLFFSPTSILTARMYAGSVPVSHQIDSSILFNKFMQRNQ